MIKNNYDILKMEPSELGQQERISGDGFFISYAIAGSGPYGDETALVKDHTFLILDGDWREDYRPIVSDGYEACKDLFEKNRAEYLNSWSN